MATTVPALHALAVYAESLIARRRIVVFGEADTEIEARLEELGAVAVVLVRPQDDLSLLRGARFDVALVTDLGLRNDPAALLASVRLAVGDAGVALVAAVNRDVAGPDAPGAFDYYDLFDLVAAQFADVRMIARLPFDGVAFAEMSDEESPAVSVDTHLAEGGHAPEAFIALASQRGVRLDPYAIIELAALEVEPHDDLELDVLRGALIGERARAETLAAQLPELEARALRAAELDREVAVRVRQVAALSAQLEQMAMAVEAERGAGFDAAELALRADGAERLIAELAPRAEHAERRVAELALRADGAERLIAELAPRAEHAERLIAELAPRAEQAERLIAELAPEVARSAAAYAHELGRLEESLRERAAIIRQLEVELARRERMILDLVQTLDEHAKQLPPSFDPAAVDVVPVSPAVAPSRGDERVAVELAEDNARLCERLDAMALELARREADAQAAAWTISELQRQADPPAAPAALASASTGLEQTLASTLDELDALRKALVQEHELRMRAETAAAARGLPTSDAPVSGAS